MVIRSFLSTSGAFHPVMLVLYTMLYFFLAIWTYGLSVPSGIFIPSLLIGAGWGRLIGIAVESMHIVRYNIVYY